VSKAELHAALAKAQGEFPPIVKNRTVKIFSKKMGREFSFRYADLEEIITKTRPALSKHGLAVMQMVETDDQGAMVLHTVLTHAAGESVAGTFVLPPANSFDDPKSLGAYISYIRRYALSAALCIAADDDLDEADDRDGGDEGGAPEKPTKPAPRAKADKTETKMASPGEVAWLKKKLENREDAREILAKHNVESIDEMENSGLTAEVFSAIKKAVLA
jgi:hypothetical protein